MTGPIDPLRPYGERRQTRRRAEDAEHPATFAEDGTNLPVVIEPQDPPHHAEPPKPEAYTAFAAHIYGQSQQRRGLKGGKPVLDAARSAYLETEYSGPDDRRPPKGLLKKTEI